MRRRKEAHWTLSMILTLLMIIVSALPAWADPTQPQLKIINLELPEVTNAGTLSISGRAPGAKRVTVMETEAVLDQAGNFTASILLRAGPNRVEVSAYDRTDQAEHLIYSVQVDQGLVPVLSKNPFVEWTGKTDPGTTIHFGGKQVPVGPDGDYRVRLNTSRAGTNSFRLDFTSPSGRTYFHQAYVLRPVVLTTPSHTNLDSLLLDGVTDSTFTVHLDGQPVNVAKDGSFRLELPLKQGANRFVLETGHVSVPWRTVAPEPVEVNPSPSSPKISPADIYCEGVQRAYSQTQTSGPIGVLCGTTYYPVPNGANPSFVPHEATEVADWSMLPPLDLPPYFSVLTGIPASVRSTIEISQTLASTAVNNGVWTLTLPRITPGTIFRLRGRTQTVVEPTGGPAEMRIPVGVGYNEVLIDYDDPAGQPRFMRFGINVVRQTPIVRLSIGSRKARIDDRQETMLVAPRIETGVTLVPLRFVAEALGAQLSYDSATHTIDLTLDQHAVQLVIGRGTALVDGRTVDLAAPAQIEDGTTLVPLRFVAEGLGANLRWNGTTRTITLSLGEIPPDPARRYDPLTEGEIREALDHYLANPRQNLDTLVKEYLLTGPNSVMLVLTPRSALIYALWDHVQGGGDLTMAHARRLANVHTGGFGILAKTTLPSPPDQTDAPGPAIIEQAGGSVIGRISNAGGFRWPREMLATANQGPSAVSLSTQWHFGVPELDPSATATFTLQINNSQFVHVLNLPDYR